MWHYLISHAGILNLRVLISFFGASICLFLGFLAYRKNPNKKENLYFFIFNLSIFLWNSSDFIGPFLAFEPETMLNYYRFSYLGGLTLILAFFKMVSYSFEKEETMFEKMFFKLAFCTVLGLLLILPSNLFIESVVYNGSFQEYPGNLYNIFSACFALTFVYNLYRLSKKLFSTNKAEKIKAKYFFVALFFALLCGCFAFFAILTNFSSYSYIGIYGFEITYSLILFFGITKHELMSIKIVLNKSGSFVITLAIFAFGYLTLIVWPYYRWISHAIDTPFLLLSIAYGGFIVGLYFHKLQRFIQTSAAKKFLKLDYNFEKALQAASSELVYADSEKNVIDAIFSLQANLEIGLSFAFIRNPESNTFNFYHINHTESETGETSNISTEVSSLSINHPLIAAFFNHTSSVTLFSKLSSHLQELLAAFSIHPKSIVLTVHSFKQLQAVFIMGQKLAEDDYTDQDQALFDVVVNQAIIIFERITRTRELLDKQMQLQDINVRQMKTLDDLRQAQLKISEFGQRYQRLAERYRHHSEMALYKAKELSHRAALAELTMGVSHEIRNPLTVINAGAEDLLDMLKGHDGVDENPWLFTIEIEELKKITGDHKAATDIWNWLLEQRYIDSESNPNINDYNPFLSTIAFNWPEPWNVFEEAITHYFSDTAKKCLILEYLADTKTCCDRVIRITSSMMQYGANHAINKDHFLNIPGVNLELAEQIFEDLMKNEFLDPYGGTLKQFKPQDPSFMLRLRPELQAFEPAVIDIIKQSKSIPKTPLDINGPLFDALKVVKNKFTYETRLHHSYKILADQVRIFQVFSILFNNAMEAMADNSNDKPQKIIVHTKDSEIILKTGESKKAVLVSVQDFGCGIKEENIEKLSNPFFSTKNVTGGKNAGLGLSILFEIVERHGGTVTIDTKLKEGTTFRLLFPC